MNRECAEFRTTSDGQILILNVEYRAGELQADLEDAFTSIAFSEFTHASENLCISLI